MRLLDSVADLELTGPLGTRWWVGLISFTLEPRGGATLLRLSHRALGEIAPDTEASYDEGWRDLLERRLPAFAEQWERLGEDNQGGKEARRSKSTGYFRGRASFPPPQLR